MFQERERLEKTKELEMKMRNRADLLNQIQQKIKRKYDEELKEKEYAIIIEQNVKKMAIRENYNQDQTVITYEQTGRSTNTNELGMREMQARVYEKRNEQKQLMKDDICVELAGYLMDDYHCSREEAIDMLYTSDTFERLQADATGLYYQSPGYVYSFLQNELKTARVE